MKARIPAMAAGAAMSTMIVMYCLHANMACLKEPVAPHTASGIISVMPSAASANLRTSTWR